MASELQQTIARDTLIIEKTLTRLLTERYKLQMRQNFLNKNAQKLCIVFDGCEDSSEHEYLEQAIEQHVTFASDIVLYLEHFNKEYCRIIEGFTSAKELQNTNAKKKFLEYIKRDALSALKNIKQTRNEYKEVFLRLKELSQFWI